MLQTISNFYLTIVHPFSEKVDEEKLDYFEILGISWMMHFLYSFYSIFAVFLGVKAFEYASESNENLSQMIYGSFNLSMQKIAIIGAISEAIFYPIVFHFSYKFWLFLLKFFAQIYNSEVDVEEKTEDVLHAIYASNVFLVIPVFGKLISFLVQAYYLYQGLQKKLGFTNVQSILVMMTPFFMMFLCAILIVSYFFFLFTLI